MFYNLEKIVELLSRCDELVSSLTVRTARFGPDGFEEEVDPETVDLDEIDSSSDVLGGTIELPQSLYQAEGLDAIEYQIEFEDEIDLYQSLKYEISNYSEADFFNNTMKEFTSVEDPYSLYNELGDNFIDRIDEDAFREEFPDCDDSPMEYTLDRYQDIKEGLQRMLSELEKEFAFKNKYEKEIIVNSPNGNDLLYIKDAVHLTEELEDLSHYAGQNNTDNEPFLTWVISGYETNPLAFFSIMCGDYDLWDHVDAEPINDIELAEAVIDDDDYHTDVYFRLQDMFQDTYHFVPKVLPQLECGLINTFGYEISDETLKKFVDDFDRKAVAQAKDSMNPAFITLSAMGKIQPANITKEQKEILSTYMWTTEMKNYYKIPELLNQSVKGSKLDDYINVVKHADVAAEYLKSIDGRHDVSIKEVSQEITHQWREHEKEKYEEKYHFSFADNKIEIEGAEKMIEMNGMKAYILPPDDLRNFTVGYDTDCCQHYGSAGEDCVTAAVTRPNAGIFVIEKDEKIEAQAFVWVTGHADENGKFVFDGLAFDNIEFANDQNLNKHHLVEKGYSDGITRNEYRAVKKTMDYEGILAAYVKELPYENVYMGTSYNAMNGIGEALQSKLKGNLEQETEDMAGRAIGFKTYTDFNENARILKYDGEMCMNAQKEMVYSEGKMMPTDKEVSYSVSEQSFEIAEHDNETFEHNGLLDINVKEWYENNIGSGKEKNFYPSATFRDVVNAINTPYQTISDALGTSDYDKEAIMREVAELTNTSYQEVYNAVHIPDIKLKFVERCNSLDDIMTESQTQSDEWNQGLSDKELTDEYAK